MSQLKVDIIKNRSGSGAPQFPNGIGVTGISSITVDTSADGGPGLSTVTVGVGSTALYVEGNARVTGLFAIGTSSIIFDGENNVITVAK